MQVKAKLLSQKAETPIAICCFFFLCDRDTEVIKTIFTKD